MKWTVNNMRRLYKELNTKAFDNTLPMVIIKLSYNTYMTYDNNKIRPCGLYDGRKQKSITLYVNNLEPGQVKETMLHEMIHLMQHINGRKLKHGNYFFKHLRKACEKANVRFDDEFYIATKFANR